MERLRVGLLLDGERVPAWAARMIDEIAREDDAKIVLLVFDADAAAPAPARATLPRRLWRHRCQLVPLAARHCLEAIYRGLVDRHPSLPDPFAEEALPEPAASAPRLLVRPERSRWSDRFSEADLATLREHRLDVLVRCGFRILRGGVLEVARYGVWSLHHGDNRVNRGGPPAFWETMEGWPAVGSILQILGEDLDNGRVLYRSWSCVDPLSLRDTRAALYWKSLHFIPRKLRELRRDGPESFFDRVEEENRAPDLYDRRLYRKASTPRLAALVARKLFEKAGVLLGNRLFLKQWQLRYRFDDEPGGSLRRYRPLVPPPDRFWADPHVAEHGGGHCVFFEEYPYLTRTGRIAMIPFDEAGRPGEPETVLEEPYHLSYPFVFQHEGRWFMIPESAANRSVDLYEATDFPRGWERRRTLLKGERAVDATLHRQDGLWWLFVNLAPGPGASTWDELHLYSSDDLLEGEWRPHPRNPVVSDCRRARPAGPLFRHREGLYRPSQNCSRRYGYGLNFARIETLTPEEYRETLVAEAAPDWEPRLLGVHSYASVGRLRVIDVLVRRPRWAGDHSRPHP